jgi:ATP-dependent RNA helicase DDX46/PRP5
VCSHVGILSHNTNHTSAGFLDKVKSGSAKQAGSGFGGKGLDRLDKDRDDKAKAERKAYGEPDEEKAAAAEKAPETKEGAAAAEPKEGDELNFGNFKVEVKRGPAPDSNKLGIAGAAAAARRLVQAKEEERIQASLKTAEDAASRAGKETPAGKQALSVVAKLNAQLRAHRLVAASLVNDDGSMKKTNPDSTEFHAIIPINDYPQKARWKVTNKETMVQLVDMTGASVTNKGIYYEPNKDPPADGPPKLHLLIESNDEFRVEQAVREIKRLLIEASAAALQAEMRNPTQTYARYSVV